MAIYNCIKAKKRATNNFETGKTSFEILLTCTDTNISMNVSDQNEMISKMESKGYTLLGSVKVEYPNCCLSTGETDGISFTEIFVKP